MKKFDSEYIRQELDLMKKDCERLGITPDQWIERFASEYYKTYRDQLLFSALSDMGNPRKRVTDLFNQYVYNHFLSKNLNSAKKDERET